MFFGTAPLDDWGYDTGVPSSLLTRRGLLYSACGLPLLRRALAQVPDPETAVIRFFGGVDFATVGKLIADVESFMRQGRTKITIQISSSGGVTVAALAAYQYLKGQPLEITTHNFGSVASAAVILFCAGSKRYSTPLGTFNIHGSLWSSRANQQLGESQLREAANTVSSERRSISLILSEVTGRTEAETAQWIDGRVVWTAKEALEANLIQEIRSQLETSSQAATASIVGSEELAAPDADSASSESTGY